MKIIKSEIAKVKVEDGLSCILLYASGKNNSIIEYKQKPIKRPKNKLFDFDQSSDFFTSFLHTW